ncbi:MAG: hypothetical protein J6K39_02010 [Clostridia bacterium]|nr:hypothetical protein [Clostridia bacterium]
MKYGDVSFADDSKLGKIEDLIASIGACKSEQFLNKELSYLDFSNKIIGLGEYEDVTSNEWLTKTDAEGKEIYTQKMAERAGKCEQLSKLEDDYSELLKKELIGIEPETVKHFLSERKTAYEKIMIEARTNGDDYEADLARGQMEACIRAQRTLLFSQNKSK